MKNLVFDSWALIAFLQDVSSESDVEDYINKVHSPDIGAYISVINLGEIWYSFARRRSGEFADRILLEISNLSIEVIDADWDQAYRAAQFKAIGGLAYADCFGAALAQSLDASLITGDPEFEKISETVRIAWV